MSFLQTASLPSLWLACLAFVGSASLLSTAFGIAGERWGSSARRIWALEAPAEQVRAEQRGYLAFVLMLATLGAGWLWAGAVTFGPESARGG